MSVVSDVSVPVELAEVVELPEGNITEVAVPLVMTEEFPRAVVIAADVSLLILPLVIAETSLVVVPLVIPPVDVEAIVPDRDDVIEPELDKMLLHKGSPTEQVDVALLLPDDDTLVAPPVAVAVVEPVEEEEPDIDVPVGRQTPTPATFKDSIPSQFEVLVEEPDSETVEEDVRLDCMPVESTDEELDPVAPVVGVDADSEETVDALVSEVVGTHAVTPSTLTDRMPSHPVVGVALLEELELGPEEIVVGPDCVPVDTSEGELVPVGPDEGLETELDELLVPTDDAVSVGELVGRTQAVIPRALTDSTPSHPALDDVLVEELDPEFVGAAGLLDWEVPDTPEELDPDGPVVDVDEGLDEPVGPLDEMGFVDEPVGTHTDTPKRSRDKMPSHPAVGELAGDDETDTVGVGEDADPELEAVGEDADPEPVNVGEVAGPDSVDGVEEPVPDSVRLDEAEAESDGPPDEALGPEVVAADELVSLGGVGEVCGGVELVDVLLGRHTVKPSRSTDNMPPHCGLPDAPEELEGVGELVMGLAELVVPTEDAIPDVGGLKELTTVADELISLGVGFDVIGVLVPDGDGDGDDTGDTAEVAGVCCELDGVCCVLVGVCCLLVGVSCVLAVVAGLQATPASIPTSSKPTAHVVEPPVSDDVGPALVADEAGVILLLGVEDDPLGVDGVFDGVEELAGSDSELLELPAPGSIVSFSPSPRTPSPRIAPKMPSLA